MQNLGELTKASTKRPYWLLLALALFFAGQIATASHWHDDAQPGAGSSLDIDCALCVLSSATGAALAITALTIAAVAFGTFLAAARARAFASQYIRAYQSRAPPIYS